MDFGSLFTPNVFFCGLPGLGVPVAKKAIFHGPATIVLWADGTKTVVKCSEDDTFSKETGISLCFMKKALGNNGRYNNTLRRLLKESDHG